MKEAVNVIICKFRRRKLNKKIVLKQMRPKIPEIIKAQALVRGWIARKFWLPEINQAKWQKKKIKIGMTKIKEGLEDNFDNDELDDLVGFFHDEKRVKGENFDKELILPDHENEEMKQMLSIINRKPKASLPPLNAKSSVIRQHSNNDNKNAHFGSGMNPAHTDRSNLSEINRKMLKNNNEYISANVPDIAFYHGPGAKRERSPTSVSGAITEIDLNSEKHQRESIGSYYNNQPIVNNLMNNSRGSFGESHATRQTNMKEQKKKYVDSWGVQNEESKKILEARYMKMAKLKNKKKILTADDRLQMFRKQSKKY
jgi:hypothetical protein